MKTTRKQKRGPFLIHLGHPLTFSRDGFPVVVTSLTVRAPNKDEARLLSDSVGLDQTFGLLALLADVPVTAIEDLRARDFYAVCEALTKI